MYILFFTFIGYWLFHSYAPQEHYFDTFDNAFISLFILMTTANYPDVMLPYYRSSFSFSFFFFFFLFPHSRSFLSFLSFPCVLVVLISELQSKRVRFAFFYHLHFTRDLFDSQHGFFLSFSDINHNKS